MSYRFSLRILATVTGIGAGVAFAPVAYADNINPPPWAGQPCSTHTETFLISGSFAAAPCPFPLSPVSPVLLIIEPGEFVIILPNFDDDLPFKLIRIQVTGESMEGRATFPEIDVFGTDHTDGPVSAELLNLALEFPCMACTTGNTYTLADFLLRPNPDFERIEIVFDPTVFTPTQIVIDTISVPEPATLAIFGLGLAAIGAMRRRRSA